MLETLPTILIAAAESATKPEAVEPMHSVMHEPLMLLTRVGVGLLVLGILLCLYRMIKGPHLADRVLAGDTVAMLVAGLVVVLAIKYDSALFYDAALVVAILGFVSTVAFAQYIGARRKYADDPADPADNNAEDSA
ncbi:MAG: monovalent cation/H+ antiporter complex subunit F [Phycisphaeraceae bacterium]